MKLADELADALDSAIEIAVETNKKNSRREALEELKRLDKSTDSWTKEDPSSDEFDKFVKELDAAVQIIHF